MKLSNKINFQQIPKIKEFLECFEVDPNWIFVASDFAAIEPKVQTVFSQDSTMLEVYASGKPHDIYLYTAGRMWPKHYDELDAVYNFQRPTKESVEEAKSKFKKLRKVAKTFHLASGYGAGVAKIRKTLLIEGMNYSFEECKEMHTNYWKAFRGIKDWNEELKLERQQNNGYIRNGMGRPMWIPEDMQKDLVSRFTQSTAHDCLLIFIEKLWRKRQEQGLENVWYPVVSDFHDETIWSCKEELLPQITEIFKECYKELNEELKWSVEISGEVVSGPNLAHIKLA